MYLLFSSAQKPLMHLGMRNLSRMVAVSAPSRLGSIPRFYSDEKKSQGAENVFSKVADNLNKAGKEVDSGLGEAGVRMTKVGEEIAKVYGTMANSLGELGPAFDKVEKDIKSQADDIQANKTSIAKQSTDFEVFVRGAKVVGAVFLVFMFGYYVKLSQVQKNLPKNQEDITKEKEELIKFQKKNQEEIAKQREELIKLQKKNQEEIAKQKEDALQAIQKKSTSNFKDQLLREIDGEVVHVQQKLNDSLSSYYLTSFFGVSRGYAHREKLRALGKLRSEVMNSKGSTFQCSEETKKCLIAAYNYWPEEEDKQFKQNFIDVYLGGNAKNSQLVQRR